MKKILLPGLAAGLLLLLLSIAGLYLTIWVLPRVAEEYFSPVFAEQQRRILIFYVHPFLMGMALAWFWHRFKTALRGNFITKGIEFGLIYTLVAQLPMLWMVYSAIAVSLSMVLTWLLLGLLQGICGGLLLEKLNP